GPGNASAGGAHARAIVQRFPDLRNHGAGLVLLGQAAPHARLGGRELGRAARGRRRPPGPARLRSARPPRGEDRLMPDRLMPDRIAVIAPGAMGSAIAAVLTGHGAQVLTLL